MTKNSLNSGSRQAEWFDYEHTLEEVIQARGCSRETAYMHKGLYPPAHGDTCDTPGLHDAQDCPVGIPARAMTGKCGWPRAFITSGPFRGELGLACPQCGAQDYRMGIQYPPYGTGAGGRGRLGDPGAVEYIECKACGHTDQRASKS